MRKGISIILVCLIGITIPIGIYVWIQNNVGDLGNLNVIAYYVPWIFHLMLWQFAFFVWLGLMLLILFFGEKAAELSKEEMLAIRIFWSEFEAARIGKPGAPSKSEKKKTKKKPSRKAHPHPKSEAEKKSENLKAEKSGEQIQDEEEKQEPGSEQPNEVPAAWQEEEFE